MNLPDARTVLSRAAAALATTPDPAEPSALPSQVAAFLRWGITALGATLVAHHVLSAARSNEIAGGVMLVAPLIWSWRQKRAANLALRAALVAPALIPRSVSESLKTPEIPMSFRDQIDALLAPEGPIGQALAALPPDTAANLTGLVNDGLTAVKAAADGEIAVAEKKMPPELAPFASSFASFLDSEDAAARAAADAKLQQIAAARAVVAG